MKFCASEMYSDILVMLTVSIFKAEGLLHGLRL
jgi:hypothetical protein